VSKLEVHHFGPDSATVGGMATAIRVLTEYNVGADRVYCHPSWRPDSPFASAWLIVACAHALLRMPNCIAHFHVSEGGSFLREGSLVALSRRLRLATVVTIHGASFLEFAHRHPRLVTTVLRRANVIVCLDPDVLSSLRRAIPSVRSELVPNPVAVADNPASANETDQLVVFAGEISLRKGADILHRAWTHIAERCPEARCLMIGPAADFTPPSLERLFVSPPVDAVALRSILCRARVVALPSRAEGMPMILAEAMSLRRPFVSTPVGSIRELAAHGGRLVPIDDAVALAESVIELLMRPELARSLGDNGRSFCIDTRSPDVIGAQMRDLYTIASSRYL
jgi:glycosyltransferase involved in cell wall biosynthesis